ncbi:cytochrome C biosynthesis protein [Gudongella sp. SC589]|jgi:membrane associated rhomboid family serine protease|uniref:cytochrome C biosynthesis protein n=1 Tax=Gudongella sp. SC589 TaxID=3385990 RepID=UPI003904AC5C
METFTSLFSKVKDILAELGGYYDDSRMIIYVTAGVMGITLLTHLIFRKIRIMKYLPGLIVLGIGLFNLYSVMDTLTADESLVNLLLFIIGTVAGLVGMLFALIIGIYSKPVKKKRRNSKTNKTEKTEEAAKS